MKTFLALLLTCSTTAALAQSSLQDRINSEFGLDLPMCHYQLVGAGKRTVSADVADVGLDECKARAKEALNRAAPGYDKAMVKHHESMEWIVIERD